MPSLIIRLSSRPLRLLLWVIVLAMSGGIAEAQPTAGESRGVGVGDERDLRQEIL